MLSLKKNLQHHVDSLLKFNIRGRKVIFLIELQDALMGIYKDGIFKKFYELHADKNAIQIIKRYIHQLNYIIFKATDRLEIIDMRKINELYDKSYIENDIRGGRRTDICLLIHNDICIF